MESDKELEKLTAKRMREMKKRVAVEREKEKKAPVMDSREILTSKLVDRGVEVLQVAESSYPAQTQIVIERLAEMIKKGMIHESISGGELLSVFRSLGMRVSVDTTISVGKHGRTVSLAEKLKGKI